jgi:hypothetical protein
MKPVLFLLSILSVFGGIPGALVEIETYNWNLFTHSYKIVAVPEVVMLPEASGKEFRSTGNHIFNVNFVYSVNDKVKSHIGEVLYTIRGNVPRNYPALELGGTPKHFLPSEAPAEHASICGILYRERPFFIDCRFYALFQTLKDTKQKMLLVFRDNIIVGIDSVNP